MANFIFEESHYEADNIGFTLWEAIRGYAPIRNEKHYYGDTVAWAMDLVEAARGKEIGPAIGKTLAEMMLSDEKEAQDFAFQIGGERLMEASLQLEVMKHLMLHSMENADKVAIMASVYERTILNGNLIYSTEVRSLAANRMIAKNLLRLFVRRDRAWFLEHLDSLLPIDPKEVITCIAWVTFDFTRTELETLRDEMEPHLASLYQARAGAIRQRIADQLHTISVASLSIDQNGDRPIGM